MESSFAREVYKIVIGIPEGQVATYGQIALLLSNPRCARMVGKALHDAPAFMHLPCHRVVNSAGRTAPDYNEQKDLLLREGVTFLSNGCVDLKKHCFIHGTII